MKSVKKKSLETESNAVRFVEFVTFIPKENSRSPGEGRFDTSFGLHGCRVANMAGDHEECADHFAVGGFRIICTESEIL